MSGKFSYIMTGVGLTLLVILGVAAVIFSTATANETTLPGESPQIVTEMQRGAVVSDKEVVAEKLSSQEPAETTGDNNDDYLKSGLTTDSALIVTTVKEFAARQEAALLGKPGWIYVRRIEVASDEQREGNYGSPTGISVPFVELVPVETPIFEGWSHVDETGLYHEALGLVTSGDGTIHQHSVLFEGQWTHLTLQAKGFPPEQYRSSHSLTRVHLPTSYTAQWLEEIQNLVTVTLTAYLTDEKYVVVKESAYKEPFMLGSPERPELPAPAVGDKMTYTFDAQTGQLLSEEVYYILEDGSMFLAGKSEYHVEFMLELPSEKAPLYYDAVDTIKGER